MRYRISAGITLTPGALSQIVANHNTRRERFYEPRLSSSNSVIEARRHTLIEAAEQALPNSRARGGGRTETSTLRTIPCV
jgi:hypothetical protein